MDIRLEHNPYTGNRKIMKHSNEMTDDELTELLRLIEERRLNELQILETMIYELKHQELFQSKEIRKYEEAVKNNNHHFCVCGILYSKSSAGRCRKWRCGKEMCQVYEK